MNKKIFPFLSLLLVLVAFVSCKKEQFSSLDKTVEREYNSSLSAHQAGEARQLHGTIGNP